MHIRGDVCVIGAGLMGLNTAYYLTKEGKSVVLLEQKEVANGASGACDDMIMLQSKKPGLMLELAMSSLEIYHGLTDELQANIGFDTRGATILIQNERELAVMEGYSARQRESGLDVVILERKDLLKYQPHVGPAIIAGTYSYVDSQVDPLRFMRSLLAHASAKGMQFVRHAKVTGVARKAEHWEVTAEGGVTVECECVVNACGAWSPEIGRMVGLEIPITPRKGQLAITEQIPAIGKTNVLSAAYIASKIDPSLAPEMSEYDKSIGKGFSFTQTYDGNYLIGSTREQVGFDKSTYQQAITNIIRQACFYFPILESVSIIRTIAGFRPACADGMPIVGEVKELPGFYICAGHEGDGVALAPLTGKNLAAMIAGRPYDTRFDKLNFSRFSR